MTGHVLLGKTLLEGFNRFLFVVAMTNLKNDDDKNDNDTNNKSTNTLAIIRPYITSSESSTPQKRWTTWEATAMNFPATEATPACFTVLVATFLNFVAIFLDLGITSSKHRNMNVHKVRSTTRGQKTAFFDCEKEEGNTP